MVLQKVLKLKKQVQACKHYQQFLLKLKSGSLYSRFFFEKNMNILLITGNAGKAAEFKKLLDIPNVTLDHKKLDLHEIQETDIRAISRFKSEQAIQQAQKQNLNYDAVLTDDTALQLDALNGLPGPLIKWFLDRLEAKGIWELTNGKKPEAQAVCMLGLGWIQSGKTEHFAGTVEGKLVEPVGNKGFGWDGIFLPNHSEKTYGELSDIEKNRISHRAKAVEKLKIYLQNL